jgi:hypoxanthine phosphoribosyltransferase
MTPLQIIWLAISIIAAVVTIVVGIISCYDYYLSAKINRAEKETIPIRIRKSLTYSQFHKGLEKIHRILDEMRFVPDVVIGIHYQGLSFAALLAKLFYVPIKNAEIIYEERENQRDIDKVIFDFDPNTYLMDKNVLIVDNSIQTGRTLKMVRDEVVKYTPRIKTLVLYKKTELAQSVIQPDLILFSSDQPRRLLK